MNTSNWVVYASILHIFYVVLLCGDISDMDGNDWLGSSEGFKVGYAVGHISACNYVFSHTPSISFQTSLDSYPTEWQQQGSEAFERIYSLRYSADSLAKVISPMDSWLALLADGEVNNAYRSHYIIEEISAGQIVDGLDELYSDFKNRNIKITDAVYVVKKQIRGSSQTEIELILCYLRSGKDAGPVIFIENEQGETEMIEFP